MYPVPILYLHLEQNSKGAAHPDSDGPFKLHRNVEIICNKPLSIVNFLHTIVYMLLKFKKFRRLWISTNAPDGSNSVVLKITLIVVI